MINNGHIFFSGKDKNDREIFKCKGKEGEQEIKVINKESMLRR